MGVHVHVCDGLNMCIHVHVNVVQIITYMDMYMHNVCT